MFILSDTDPAVTTWEPTMARSTVAISELTTSKVVLHQGKDWDHPGPWLIPMSIRMGSLGGQSI